MISPAFDCIIINEFDDVIKAVTKAIDDVKKEEISQPSFCTLIDSYFNNINKLRQQICGATPKTLPKDY